MNISQFDLFAQSFCEDLEKINQRVQRLSAPSNYQQPVFDIKAPTNPPSSRGRMGASRGIRFRITTAQKVNEEKNKNSISTRISTAAKIVKPKRNGALSPRV